MRKNTLMVRKVTLMTTVMYRKRKKGIIEENKE